MFTGKWNNYLEIGETIENPVGATGIQGVTGPTGITGFFGPTGPLGVNSTIAGVQVFTTPGTGTYTSTLGTRLVLVEMLGGGGGGGGSSDGVGSGGGSGGYIRQYIDLFTLGITSFAYAVGSGGAGGLPGFNAGTNGGNTTISPAAFIYTAGGGQGGDSMTAIDPRATILGGAGGVVTVNTGLLLFAISGQAGGLAFREDAGSFYMISGQGGSSRFGGGGYSTMAYGTFAGIAGAGKGSGGSGSFSTASSEDSAGGDGAPGFIYITEYL